MLPYPASYCTALICFFTIFLFEKFSVEVINNNYHVAILIIYQQTINESLHKILNITTIQLFSIYVVRLNIVSVNVIPAVVAVFND